MPRDDTFKFVLVEKGQVVLGKDIKVRSEGYNDRTLADTGQKNQLKSMASLEIISNASV